MDILYQVQFVFWISQSPLDQQPQYQRQKQFNLQQTRQLNKLRDALNTLPTVLPAPSAPSGSTTPMESAEKSVTCVRAGTATTEPALLAMAATLCQAQTASYLRLRLRQHKVDKVGLPLLRSPHLHPPKDLPLPLPHQHSKLARPQQQLPPKK